MPHCHTCDATVDTEALVRHELPRLTLVHCPTCETLIGQYRRHGDDPETDLLRSP